MKAFHVTYRERGSYGYYNEYDYIVIASDTNRAIELAKQGANDAPRDDCWEAEEIDLTKENAVFISHSES